MPLTLTTAVYCERLGTSLWAEPLNATSNLVFFIVGIILTFQLNRMPLRLKRRLEWLLIYLLYLIGIGSLLWHTTVKWWAQWLDVVPIALFIGIYLLAYSYRILHKKPRDCLLLLGGFGISHLLIAIVFPLQAFNGSLFYLPTLFSIPLLAWATPATALGSKTDLRIASLTFFLAFIARSSDQMLCPYLSTGTHFIWHILVGITLFLAVRTLLHQTS